MIKLLAVDMDGTLLDENSQIPPETHGLIRELREAGVRFAVSSGRNHPSLVEFWGETAPYIDYIASNGTQVVCDGKVLENVAFDRDALVRLKEVCDRVDCLHLLCLTADRHYIMELDWELTGPPPGEVEYESRATEVPYDPIFKVVVVNEREQDISDILFALSHEVGDCLKFLPYTARAIDVMPNDVSKATGLEAMRTYLGIEREEIAAYGDSMNDYEMMRYAGSPRAMSNACYVLRAFADEILGSNAEHAVQKDMQRIIDEARGA